MRSSVDPVRNKSADNEDEARQSECNGAYLEECVFHAKKYVVILSWQIHKYEQYEK